MIKYIRATIIFTMIISIVTLFAGCDQLTNSFGGIDLSILDNLTSKKQVPVYSGMTVSTIPITSASASANAKDKTDVDYSGNNGNHNGHFKGDYEDNNSSIDTSNPFPDNNQTIEDSIDDSLNVLESNSVKYYGVTNGDIYINIHISNPDQFEILSFTLNGVKYSNYMFEPGSNMELIILKLNVGKVSGLIEYTIDAIKYIDGSTIKDAIIAGDQTVAVGIKDDDQVTAKISELEVETNKISFNVIINDRDNLIGLSNGSVQAILYDGNSIIATKDLSLGKNFVKFENLKTGTVYQYAIVGFYDDFSGIGFDSNLLYKNAVSTDAIVLFSNITLSYNTIDFDFIWMDDYSKKKLTSLSLYKDGELLKSLSTDTTRIDDLLSANTYKLIARYENNGIEEEIYLEFTTAKFVAPNITISLVFKTQTSITFDIIENDDQDLGNIISIDLYNENGKIAEADSLDTREFIGLESDSTYTIKVTYLYNLKDGSAPITTTSSITCSLEKDFAYGIDPSNNTIMITKSRLSYAEEIIIPDTIDGYTVSGIASYAFADHSGLKKLVIPNSVTFIDYAALSGCSSLTDLSIPYVGSPLESSEILYPFGYIFGSDFYNNSVAINQIP